MAIKVFTAGSEFKSLKREVDVVQSLPPHDNIVTLYGVEEEVRWRVGGCGEEGGGPWFPAKLIKMSCKSTSQGSRVFQCSRL